MPDKGIVLRISTAFGLALRAWREQMRSSKPLTRIRTPQQGHGGTGLNRMVDWLSPRCALAFLALASGLAGYLPAQAQQPAICAQIRAELARLPEGGGNRNAGRANRQVETELARVQLALQQNDCGRRGFLFFDSAPAVCGPLRARASQLQAALQQNSGGGDARRAQLQAALQQNNCFDQQRGNSGIIYAAPNSPSLFDRLFGSRTPQDVVIEDPGLSTDRLDGDGEKKERLGGRMPVCVRTCDGYFFPVNFEGLGGRDDYASVCHALCPAAETQLYFMRLGADISSAATREGEAYSSLPTALKYRETRVENCACKAVEQTWAQVLSGADDIVEARKGDILVTEEQALRLSRPKSLAEPATGKKSAQARREEARKQEEAAKQLVEARRKEEAASEAPIPESALPTGGSASSGIGPKLLRENVLGAHQGVQQEVISADGVKRQIRVVAPELAGQNRPADPKAALRP